MTRGIKLLIYGFTLLGIVLFLSVIFITIFSKNKFDDRTTVILLGVGAFLTSLSWIYLAILKVRTWTIVDAVCITRELNKVMSPNQDMSGWVLNWRIKCVYQHSGEKFEVYPKVGWITVGFKSEKAAEKYLSKYISPDCKCRLRFNPSNHQETELLRINGLLSQK